MDQASFIKKVTAQLRGDKTFVGLFLAGSFGRDAADKYSDVDMIAIVEPQAITEAAVRWRRLLEDLTSVIFWSERGQDTLLLNAITDDWLRCDLSIMSSSAFVARPRQSVRPLIDETGLYDALQNAPILRAPDPQKVRFLINEFIRVLGLLRVVVGRGEYITAVSGVGLLRDHFVNLMLEEVALADRGGALHLSKVLPKADMDLLLSLSFPGPKRAEVITAHFDVARQFLPRAYKLAAKIDLEWPATFEKATLQMLAARLGQESWSSLLQPS